MMRISPKRDLTITDGERTHVFKKGKSYLIANAELRRQLLSTGDFFEVGDLIDLQNLVADKQREQSLVKQLGGQG